MKFFEENTSKQSTDNNKRDRYVWGVSVVELILSQFIKLWEIQNKEMYQKKAKQQERIQKQRARRPSNMFMLHSNSDKLFKKWTAQTIESWVNSNQKAILSINEKWKKSSQRDRKLIVNWIRGENDKDVIDQLHVRQKKRILYGQQKRDNAINQWRKINNQCIH